MAHDLPTTLFMHALQDGTPKDLEKAVRRAVPELNHDEVYRTMTLMITNVQSWDISLGGIGPKGWRSVEGGVVVDDPVYDPDYVGPSPEVKRAAGEALLNRGLVEPSPEAKVAAGTSTSKGKGWAAVLYYEDNPESNEATEVVFFPTCAEAKAFIEAAVNDDAWPLTSAKLVRICADVEVVTTRKAVFK